jgi:hypothetical protein
VYCLVTHAPACRNQMMKPQCQSVERRFTKAPRSKAWARYVGFVYLQQLVGSYAVAVATMPKDGYAKEPESTNRAMSSCIHAYPICYQPPLCLVPCASSGQNFSRVVEHAGTRASVNISACTCFVMDVQYIIYALNFHEHCQRL